MSAICYRDYLPFSRESELYRSLWIYNIWRDLCIAGIAGTDNICVSDRGSWHPFVGDFCRWPLYQLRWGVLKIEEWAGEISGYKLISHHGVTGDCSRCTRVALIRESATICYDHCQCESPTSSRRDKCFLRKLTSLGNGFLLFIE